MACALIVRVVSLVVLDKTGELLGKLLSIQTSVSIFAEVEDLPDFLDGTVDLGHELAYNQGASAALVDVRRSVHWMIVVSPGITIGLKRTLIMGVEDQRPLAVTKFRRPKPFQLWMTSSRQAL